ncbi:type I pantothenate kinase [Pantoea sp. SoEX]|uniref:type I pantothenate kinase n=1 Tax=Pantoea sp. SoEX TaxID=2576763 RepID=UPI00135B9953|nr:type I pantothenate kinase [Pantoea sp. SoEX]MXP50795.1 type I pantothenate kinase [Pantoea sp. SoEX]
MTILLFKRSDWIDIYNSIPLYLSNNEIRKLKSIDSNLSITEVMDIYLPLSRLIIFFIQANIKHQNIFKKFFSKKIKKVPYIISISGSVAVGKTTTAKILQILLSKYPRNNKVEIVTTDSFLYSNETLIKRGLIEKKGFPESYDMNRLIQFILDIKLGIKKVLAPVYSHFIYDIEPKTNKIIQQPNILIIEGLHLLQNKLDYSDNFYQIFISEFVDLSIYLDATEKLLKNWFISRFLKLRQKAFLYNNSYFHKYINSTEQETVFIAEDLWDRINGLNLKKNILPTRESANIILTKKENHIVNYISFKNN